MPNRPPTPRRSISRSQRRVGSRIAAFSLLVLLSCKGGDSATEPRRVVGPPAEVELVSGDDQQGVVGEELLAALTMRVVDASGQPVAGQSVNFRVTAGGGSVFAGSAITDASGTARERWTLGVIATDSQRVEARAIDAAGNRLVFATFRARALAAAPAKLVVLTPPSDTARSSVPLGRAPAVRLTDTYGNVVSRSGVSVSVSVTAASGVALSGSNAASTDTAGVATFPGLVVSGPASAIGLTFSSNGLTGVATPLILIAGPAATIGALSPTQLARPVGALVDSLPRVVVKDAAGNVVAGAAVTFAAAADAGVISPTTASTDQLGTAAMTSWRLPSIAGAYTVTAALGGVTGQSATFTVTTHGDNATRMAIVSGDGYHGAPLSVAPPLVVRLTDDFDNAVPGAIVGWRIATAGGSLSAASTVTDAKGLTQTVATLQGAAGPMTVTAALPGNLATAIFRLTATSSVVASLAVSNNGQSFYAGGVPPYPPRVQVQDARQQGIAGVLVRYAVTAGGGTLTADTARSDAQGYSTAPGWRLGPRADVANRVMASVDTATAELLAISTAPFSVRIDQPTGDKGPSDTVFVSATLTAFQSDVRIDSVKSVIGTDTATLVRKPDTWTWTGFVRTAGLPAGTQSVLVSAWDSYRNRVSESINFYFGDVAPRIIVDTPGDGSVAQSSPLRLRAVCQDDAPGCELTLRYWVGGNVVDLTTARDTLIASFDVTSHDRGVVNFLFDARDIHGKVARESRGVFVALGLGLAPTDSVPGIIDDLDSARVLYTTGTNEGPGLDYRGRPTIRDRATGVEQQLDTSNVWFAGGSRLTPVGAVLTLQRTEADAAHVYDWRPGSTPIDVGQGRSAFTAGNYFMWGPPDGTISTRHDLLTGTDISFATQYGGARPLASGDVILQQGAPPDYDFEIFRYHAGVRTQISSDSGCHTLAGADEVRVVYQWDTGLTCGGSNLKQLIVNQGGLETSLGPAAEYVFRLNAGWLVYGDYRAPEYHVLSPSGESISFAKPGAPTSVLLESMGPNGTFTYVIARRRYAAVRSGSSYSSIDVSTDGGTPYWIEGELVIVIGGTIFATGIR